MTTKHVALEAALDYLIDLQDTVESKNETALVTAQWAVMQALEKGGHDDQDNRR